MQRISLFKYASVDLLTREEFYEKLSIWVGDKNRFRQIIFANVQVTMMARQDKKLRLLLAQSDLRVCDGKPLVVLSRLLGHKTAHFYGPSVTPEICRLAEAKGWRLGFFGGSDRGNVNLRKVLLAQFPQLKIVKMIAPPMLNLQQLSTPSFCDEFVAAECDLLFVGLGWPKQEIWSDSNRKNLPFPCINVGAAFDFISGEKKSPPAFMISLGLAWTFRLATDFRHTWLRYLKYNFLFLACAFGRLLFRPRPRENAPL